MAAAAVTDLYSTYKTYLMQGNGSDTLTYTKLADIKDYPDIGGESEQLDVTSLSDKVKKSIPGIQNNDSMQFTMNYNPTVYQSLQALCDGTAHHFALYFGASVSGSTVTPDGSDGKWTFDGQSNVYVSGKGTNEAREMIFTIYLTSEPVFTAPS